MNLFPLPSYPGVVDRHRQYYAVLYPTPVKLIQVDHLCHTLSQNWVGVDKCHRVLGELRSMAIDLPRSR